MDTNPKPIFRFAPSPNGELHLGHTYSALLNLKLAREMNGLCLLRIEDIDTVRCTPELEQQMLQDLEWIGFEWDGEPRRQSEHFEEYQSALNTLIDHGLVYPSILSRSQAKRLVKEAEQNGQSWPRDPEGMPLFPGNEKTFNSAKQAEIINSGAPYSLRLDMEKASAGVREPLTWQEISGKDTQQIKAEPKAWGDIVLARKDTPASYSLCCVCDDNHQAVTQVVRGRDLYHATSIHVLLQAILNIEPPTYFHHRLILDENNEKLSKSRKSLSLRALREAGLQPTQINEMYFNGEFSD